MTDYGSPHGSDWSTASAALRQSHPHPSGASQLTRLNDYKPSLSLLKQEVLTEEEYTEGLSDIIKRTFFPQLRELDAHNDLLRAYKSEDPSQIEESVRRMREIVTPTPRRRNRVGATPGHTPFGTEPSDTPTHFSSQTPSRATPNASSSQPSSSSLRRYDPTLSLDAFQSKYTSEDNSSFAELLAKDNRVRREKFGWAWDAEKNANAKAIRGREARERLVDLTRQMVEADPDGIVRVIEGAPGRPGERKLVVEGVKLGGNEGRLMVEGSRKDGKLMITQAGEVGSLADTDLKGKGKELARKEDFVDYDKPTADEEEDNRLPKEREMQVSMEGWKFTNRNALMFPPDANGNIDQLHSSDLEKEGIVLGEPKAIRYHATRLEEVERGAPSHHPSPTRSRINAAITGTPYHVDISSTPKVQGFSFVDALPTPRASTIDPKSLQDLMSWGTIESTPVVLRSSASAARSSLGDGGGPFKIEDTSRREALAHKMANKAKKSLASRSSSSAGGEGLRRSVLESVRGRAGADLSGSSPRSPRVGAGDLSLAGRSLLQKTGKAGVWEKGLAASPGYNASPDSREQDKMRIARARGNARELESNDRLKRQRWTPSPAPDYERD